MRASGWVSPSMTGVLITGDTDPGRRQPQGHRDGEWGDTATGQGTPGAPRSQKGRKKPPPAPPEGPWPDLGLAGSTAPVACFNPSCGPFSQQPWEAHTARSVVSEGPQRRKMNKGCPGVRDMTGTAQRKVGRSGGGVLPEAANGRSVDGQQKRAWAGGRAERPALHGWTDAKARPGPRPAGTPTPAAPAQPPPGLHLLCFRHLLPTPPLLAHFRVNKCFLLFPANASSTFLHVLNIHACKN